MKSCTSCGRQSSNKFFCECGKVLPYCWDNKFKLFGLPNSFNIDLPSLQKKYYDIISMLHPDKFHSSSVEERQIAQEHSAFINSAYKDLKDPWKRAKYLLEMLNYSSSENVDQSVLLEVIELNSIEKKEERSKIIKDKEKHLLYQIEAAFASNDLKTAYKICLHFKFIKRSAS
jgi:molecular chaperone HscB